MFSEGLIFLSYLSSFDIDWEILLLYIYCITRQLSETRSLRNAVTHFFAYITDGSLHYRTCAKASFKHSLCRIQNFVWPFYPFITSLVSVCEKQRRSRAYAARWCNKYQNFVCPPKYHFELFCHLSINIVSHTCTSKGIGAQLIGPIQLHVKKADFKPLHIF